ncbi:MAG: GFA family protein [Burkholderiales bacterium]
MSHDSIAGSCLCGAVRFEIRPPLTAFRYCYCSRCRKASGAAHAANVFLPASLWGGPAGEALIRRFDLPGAKRFAVCFCTRCGTRVPHRIAGTENMMVPAGILDASPGEAPDSCIFWASRAPWYVEPQALPKFDEYGG